MRRRTFGILAITVVALVAAACDFGLSPTTLTNLNVGPGLTPEYSWDGSPIYELEVWRVNDSTNANEALVWQVGWVSTHKQIFVRPQIAVNISL